VTYDDAERLRRMIDSHWRLRMLDDDADLWMTALIDKDAEMAATAIARLSKELRHPPKVVDLEEAYAVLVAAQPLPPPAEICQTCGGDHFVLVQKRPMVHTIWMEEHNIAPREDPADTMVEEYAPCPDCGTMINAEFRRYDGTVARPPDSSSVRDMMRR
jgi:hypothetical protein